MKKYRTRDGHDVVIYAIYGDVIHGAIQFDKLVLAEWHWDGTHQTGNTDYDLVEINAFADLNIDDKVLVWDEESDSKQRKHFAGVSERGLPMTWAYGGTSFTSTNKVEWTYCEKAND